MKQSWPVQLHAIFARQSELMATYKDIEKLPAAPLALHTTHHQKVMKDFAWRTTEELAEAFEVWINHADRKHAMEKGLEEMADALHFLVEMLIFAGVTPAQVLEQHPEFPTPDPLDCRTDHSKFVAGFWGCTYWLGRAMHELKNKPWKQTPVATNERNCRLLLIAALHAQLDLWATLGQTGDDLHVHYFKKAAVNVTRQETGY
jgi:phosphoribosyl-ATP pyrophosphohydrolase